MKHLQQFFSVVIIKQYLINQAALATNRIRPQFLRPPSFITTLFLVYRKKGKEMTNAPNSTPSIFPL